MLWFCIVLLWVLSISETSLRGRGGGLLQSLASNFSLLLSRYLLLAELVFPLHADKQCELFGTSSVGTCAFCDPHTFPAPSSPLAELNWDFRLVARWSLNWVH